jgi:hypothetical protein
MQIGARCEEMRRQHSEQGALKRLREDWGDIDDVREASWAERNRRYAQLERLRNLPQAAAQETKKFSAWVEAEGAKLAQKTEAARGRKPTAISLKRYRPLPLTRGQICRRVAKEFGITPRRVMACWVEHNKLIADSKV